MNSPHHLDKSRDDSIVHHEPSRRRRVRSMRLTLSMTPMIDVVFLLLLYFLLATDFRMNEEVFRIDLPSQDAGAAADPFKLDEEPLRILVVSTGLSADSYRLQLDGPYPQPQSFNDLHEFLRTRQVNPENAFGGTGALFTQDFPIIIQPTRPTRWEHAIEAFNAAARARYTNVTFAKPG